MMTTIADRFKKRREKQDSDIDDFFRLKDGQQVVDFEKFMASDIGQKLRSASAKVGTQSEASDAEDENSDERQ